MGGGVYFCLGFAMPHSISNPYQKQREQIDAIDQRLLQLFNQRARLALEIGGLKRERGDPIYMPERERAVLSCIVQNNRGPLPNKTILQLFQTLIACTRSLEETPTTP